MNLEPNNLSSYGLKMIVAGIDIGAQTVEVVILREGEVLAQSKGFVGLNRREAVERAWNGALEKGGLSKEEIERIVATGSGKGKVSFADEQITELVAAAKGVIRDVPSARTVIAVGAEEAHGIKCDEGGKVIDYVINEKCAAGSGTFVEAMARAIEVSLEEFTKLPFESQNKVPMNAQCVVFAESEVVSLIHAKTSKADIARAVHDGMASRIGSMVRRIGVEKEVVLIGGVARNPGFADSLGRDLGVNLLVPADPEFVSALGAALIAAG